MSRRHVDTHTYERNIGHVDTHSPDKGWNNVPLHFQSAPNYVARLGLYQIFSKLFAQPNHLLQLSGESAEISKYLLQVSGVGRGIGKGRWCQT